MRKYQMKRYDSEQLQDKTHYIMNDDDFLNDSVV